MRHFSSKKVFSLIPPPFSKIVVARLFKGVSGSRDVVLQNRLFRFFKKTAVFVFRSTLKVFLGRSHCCRLIFQEIMNHKQQELRKAIGLICLFFRHEYRTLKLRIIYCRARSVLMCKHSVYFRAPSLNFD